MDYPIGTKIICPTCRRVLFRLNRDMLAGEVLRSDDVDQVDAPHHGLGVAIACPEHGIVDRFITIVRRPDGAEQIGL